MSNPTIEAAVPAVRGGEGEARWWWGNLAGVASQDPGELKGRA
jgi:hypothetical protein